MARLFRAVAVMAGMMLAVAGLAVAAGHAGLTSDDGERILFMSNTVTNAVQLLSIKPDGTRINHVYTSLFDSTSCRHYDNTIALVNAGAVRQVLSFPTVLVHPHSAQVAQLGTLSPNGNYIALVEYADRAAEQPTWSRVIVVSRDDSSQVYNSPLLPIGYPPELRWSPDSNKVMFTVIEEVERVQAEIAVLDLSTQEIILLTDSLDSEDSPDWSPDGQRIVFSSGYLGPSGFRSDIFTMNSDGSEVIRLTSDMTSTTPSWSPDGEQIVFATTVQENFDIYVMNADGSNVRHLTNFPEPEYSPCWLTISPQDS